MALAKPVPQQKELIVVTTCDLYEPYLNIRFPQGVLTPVEEITNWMQCQIDAGLMSVKE